MARLSACMCAFVCTVAVAQGLGINLETGLERRPEAPRKGPIVLSWNPRIVLVDEFLSAAEADALTKLSMNNANGWGRTGLVTINGDKVPGDTITSQIKQLPYQDQLVQETRRRISELSMLPEDAMEPLHMLRYNSSDFFRGHLDAHALKGHPTTSRVATMLIYTGDAESGGSTFFPLAIPAAGTSEVDGVLYRKVPPGCKGLAGKDSKVQSEDEMSTYVDGFDVLSRKPEQDGGGAPGEGLAIEPKRGRAVLFWARRPDGQLDPRSHHAGCPSAKKHGGDKFVLTQWIRYQPALMLPGNVMEDWHKCQGSSGPSENQWPSELSTCAVGMVERSITQGSARLPEHVRESAPEPASSSQPRGYFFG